MHWHYIWHTSSSFYFTDNQLCLYNFSGAYHSPYFINKLLEFEGGRYVFETISSSISFYQDRSDIVTSSLLPLPDPHLRRKKKKAKRVDFGFRGGSGWMHSLRIVTEKKLGRRRGCRRHKTIDRKDGEWLVGGTANKSSWNSGCRKPVMFSIQCAKEEMEFSGISWVEFFLFFVLAFLFFYIV